MTWQLICWNSMSGLRGFSGRLFAAIDDLFPIVRGQSCVRSDHRAQLAQLIEYAQNAHRRCKHKHAQQREHY